MPNMRRSGDEAERSELPDTLRRSSQKAQRTFAKAHDSAVEEYGEGARAHRAAYAALKHSFEKKGDCWVGKSDPGPSEPRSAGSRASEDVCETFGDVDDEDSTKDELSEPARELRVSGRSKMSKRDLARAVAKEGGWPSPSTGTRRRPFGLGAGRAVAGGGEDPGPPDSTAGAPAQARPLPATAREVSASADELVAGVPRFQV